jgi:hypothetical protein
MSAFCPDDGRPPRLIRYVEVMPLPSMLTMFFRQQNLLLIDKEHWGRLDDNTRHIVLRTEEESLEVFYPNGKTPLVSTKKEKR